MPADRIRRRYRSFEGSKFLRSAGILVIVIVAAVGLAPVWAAELLEGVVVSVRPSGGSFVLLAGSELRSVTVEYRGGKLPATVAPGRRLRVRGSFAKSGVFQAVGITSAPASDTRKDPTGVRSRLLRRKTPF
jgi:hypothetical protein